MAKANITDIRNFRHKSDRLQRKPDNDEDRPEMTLSDENQPHYPLGGDSRGDSLPSSDYRLLFEAGPDPCLVLDRSLLIVSVNDAYLRATGTRREEIIGHGIFEVFPDNPAEPDATGVRNLNASLQRVLREGVTDVMAIQKYDIRKPQWEEDGGFEERFWSPVNVPVIGADNEVAYILHRVQDVTEFVHLKLKEADEERLTTELRERAGRMEAEIFNKSLEVADANLKLKLTTQELEAQSAKLQETNRRLQAEIAERILLSSLVESSNHPIIAITKGIDGVIKSWNMGAETIYGYSKEEAVGRNLCFLVPPGHQNDIPEILQTVAAGGHITDYETVRMKKDGTVIDVLLNVSPIPDANGEIIGASISGVDITERKRAEREREQSLAELEAIIERINEGVVILDLEGNVLNMNRLALSLHDFPSSADVKRKLSEYQEKFELFEAGGGLLPLEEWPLSRMIRGESFVDYVVRVRRKETGRVWIGSYNGTQVHDKSGRHILSVLTIRDVTERQRTVEEIERLNAGLEMQAAELTAANQELEAFNYTVAHDLRQPLNLLSSYCQVIEALCGDQVKDECKGYVRDAYNCTLRMSRLIEALLNFSRLSRVEPRREMVDLSAMAHVVAEELKRAEPGRRIEFRIADGVVAVGDANLLRVVLDNLLGNAWKYTGIREQAVVEFAEKDIDGETVYFVRDNGSGFHQHDADKLFVPFQRLSGAVKYQGFGIGLATVGRIIGRHGGKVWAEGEPDQGATFFFTLAAEKPVIDS